ncbi:ammonia-dependent NAD(+) synthetase [Glaciibacter psychrotolerans]|uniref:NH(3)-dependent NAD(+) synthetase n=1 Tax=Glaciibacter psychrotolerans TaxID=670054 RepID=A0A7Z0ED31_9MICO|nr:ammonia-dependent NAD(+) synthetase [Leifsonia psychrotolerans]NYJ19216.1 NAD+ synthase [Leifsonia psychrotolerans]
MREIQARIIADLTVAASIDPASEVRRRVQFLVDYIERTGASGLVLGISGGQDSSLAGRLCQLAIEQLAESGREARFVAVRLPYAVQHDEADAALALEFIRPESQAIFNIEPAVTGFEQQYRDSLGEAMTDFNKGNVKARARMIAQYAIAGQNGLLVVGTDHAAEAITGFFTKYGDGGSDLLPLAGLTKRQGRSLLIELGAPERLYLKPPTADLLDENPGQTDEVNLGLRYSDIDDYLEGLPVDDAVATALEARYLASGHKRRVPASPFDDWWR